MYLDGSTMFFNANGDSAAVPYSCTVKKKLGTLCPWLSKRDETRVWQGGP